MPMTRRLGTWAVYQRGVNVSGIEYIEAIAAAHAAGRRMAAFLTSYDVIISTPTKLLDFRAVLL